MIGTRVFQLSPDDLRPRAEALRVTGGRLQFAYAWFPAREAAGGPLRLVNSGST